MKCLLLVLSLIGLSSAIFVNNAASKCPISVTQAEDVCGALKKRSNHFTAHPTECAAFVQCDGLAQATVTAVPEGTMWDSVVGAAVHLQASSCPQSPCTTRRDISDCRTCFGYLTCQNNQVVSARCPEGQSFSRTLSTCVLDPTCRSVSSPPMDDVLLSCVQIPNTNFYRKTGLQRNVQYSVDVTCSASTVMNTTSCICVFQPNQQCPITLGDIQNLELRGGLTPYSFQALDTNELTGDFIFTITGLTISSAQGVVALASNSRADAPGCERPTFEVVADTYQRTVAVTVVTMEPRTVTVSAPLQSNIVNEIRVERRSTTLSIYVNGIRGTDNNSLGNFRVDKTLCSLDIGNSLSRASLQGTITRVTLRRECS